MIWLACQRLGRSLAGSRAGIVGRGNVGSRTLRLLRVLGADVVANDPPLADEGVAGLVSLDEALDCDIVCLHVPLTRQGPCPTWRMIDEEAIGRIARGLGQDAGEVLDRKPNGIRIYRDLSEAAAAAREAGIRVAVVRTGVVLGKENLVGTELPVLREVQIELARYRLEGAPADGEVEPVDRVDVELHDRLF